MMVGKRFDIQLVSIENFIVTAFFIVFRALMY